MRLNIRTLFAHAAFGHEIVALLGDAPESVNVLSAEHDSEQADVLLTDARGLDRAIIDDAAHADTDARTPIVALVEDDDAVAHALHRGAHAALPVSANVVQILAACHAAATGLTAQPLRSARGVGFVPDPGRTADSTAKIPLTRREREVLRLLAEGIGNKGIARRLGIAHDTAKAHVSAILSKLGARTRTEAVAKGAREGLIVF